MPFAVDDLKVCARAVDFADLCLEMTERFPRGYRFLADELNRASVSIAANLSEGNGRFPRADRKQFFGIARGAIQQCIPLLELAARRQIIDSEQHECSRAQFEALGRMISGPIKGLKKRTT